MDLELSLSLFSSYEQPQQQPPPPPSPSMHLSPFSSYEQPQQQPPPPPPSPSMHLSPFSSYEQPQQQPPPPLSSSMQLELLPPSVQLEQQRPLSLQLELLSPSMQLEQQQPPPPLQLEQQPPRNQRRPSMQLELQQPRKQRRPRKRQRSVRTETIPRRFPWAGDRRATVRSLEDLVANGITQIEGEYICRSCGASKEVVYDLISKFNEDVKPLYSKIQEYKNDRAPSCLNKNYSDCQSCGKQQMQPAIPKRKRDINWLFMLLDGSLGYLNMKCLAYFCRHNDYHRTGAKDRILYSVFVGLYSQLLRKT